MTGPVQSGIGAGYYWGWNGDCAEWTIGFSAFGFTEGLDPGTKFQVGGGVSIDLVHYRLFSIGIGAGYDLLRREEAEGRVIANGVLLARSYKGWDRALESFTWLLTIRFAPSPADETAPRP